MNELPMQPSPQPTEPTSTVWGTEVHAAGNPQAPKRVSKSMIFLIAALTVFIIGGGVLAYVTFFRVEKPQVTISFSPVADARVGQPIKIAISYANASQIALRGATLSVSLPQGVALVGKTPDVRVAEFALGEIRAGGFGEQSITVIATGDAQTIKRIAGVLRYSIASSRAEFEAAATIDLSLNDPLLLLNVSFPASVVAGEDVRLELNYQNISDGELADVRITLETPPVFTVRETRPMSAQTGKAVWNLGAVAPRASGTITVVGSAIGSQGKEFSFRVLAETGVLGNTYTLNEQVIASAIASSPFDVGFDINGEGSSFVASVGDGLRYAIRYRNTTDVPLQDITVRASLVGELFEFSSLRTSGSFDSVGNVITWTSVHDRNLTLLAPGEERTLTVEIRVKPGFPIRKLGDKNYSLKLAVQFDSPTVPQGFSGSRSLGVGDIETRVHGDIRITSAGYYFDSAPGVSNTGPYPPRVNQATRYTIHWIITNSATDVAGTRVSAFLRPGVQFISSISSPIDAKPEYNSATGEVVWNVGTVAAGKGLVSAPLEAIFQIEATPAVNQVGQDVPLIDATTLSGTDAFAGVTLSSQSSGINSGLPDDARAATFSDRRVR